MAKPGQQKFLFGRVRIDRPVERAIGVVSDGMELAGHNREADGLDKAAAKIRDPKKRAAAEKTASKYRKKYC